MSYSEKPNEIRNGLLNLHELLTEWVVNENADLAKQAQRDTTVITLPAGFQLCVLEVWSLKSQLCVYLHTHLHISIFT